MANAISLSHGVSSHLSLHALYCHAPRHKSLSESVEITSQTVSPVIHLASSGLRGNFSGDMLTLIFLQTPSFSLKLVFKMVILPHETTLEGGKMLYLQCTSVFLVCLVPSQQHALCDICSFKCMCVLVCLIGLCPCELGLCEH